MILSGIKGHEKMTRLNRKGIRKVHRTAKETSGLRAGKKLTGKIQWFRKDYPVPETEPDMAEQVER